MHFNNSRIFSVNLFGEEFWITKTIVETWAIMAALIIFTIIVRIVLHLRLKQGNDVPKGFQNVIEYLVEMMSNFVKNNMGHEYAYFGTYFFGVFIFIFASNLSGLIGFRPPTADLATTVPLALNTFLLIHVMGIATRKSKYFKEYLEPFPFFLPIHLIGEIAKPVSLSFRLFGNILGGFIIMGLIYSMFPWFLKIGIPAALNVYFDLFAGFLQAFIFTILSMTFIREKLPEEE